MDTEQKLIESTGNLMLVERIEYGFYAIAGNTIGPVTEQLSVFLDESQIISEEIFKTLVFLADCREIQTQEELEELLRESFSPVG